MCVFKNSAPNINPCIVVPTLFIFRPRNNNNQINKMEKKRKNIRESNEKKYPTLLILILIFKKIC